MKNGYKVAWTHRALTDLNSIIHYLQTNWTDKEVTGFIKKLDNRIGLIAQKPKLYPATKNRKNVHRSVLIPQVTLYYRVKMQTIEILTLFDNRQQPGKLKLK